MKKLIAVEGQPIKKYNPYRNKNMKVKQYVDSDKKFDLSQFPNFHKSGSITGMKKLYFI